MSSPTKEEVQRAVETALQHRGQDADAAQRAALACTTLGCLRRMDDPTGGILVTSLVALFGFPATTDQVAQRVVDYWRGGLRDAPPYEHRAQMPAVMADAFRNVPAPVPEQHTLGVLVNVVIRAVQDRYPNGPRAAKQGVGLAIAQAYAVG